MKKTKEEIEELKRQWRNDPNWDIEHTEGFEDHKAELEEYSEQMNADWDKEYKQKIAADMKNKGITDLGAYNWLISLEKRIQRIEDKFEIY